MRLGTVPVIRLKNKNTMGIKFRLLLFFIIFMMIITFLSLSFFRSLRPVMIRLAEEKIRYMAEISINNAVTKALKENNITYNNITILNKTQDGKINSIETNIVEVNKLKSEIAILVQQEIANLPTIKVQIPMGAIFKEDLLVGTGPNINVKVVPIGAASVDISESFISAGVNQTCHNIALKIDASVGILLPAMREDIKISTTVPIAQTVIVGEVPLFIGGIQ